MVALTAAAAEISVSNVRTDLSSQMSFSVAEFALTSPHIITSAGCRAFTSARTAPLPIVRMIVRFLHLHAPISRHRITARPKNALTHAPTVRLFLIQQIVRWPVAGPFGLVGALAQLLVAGERKQQIELAPIPHHQMVGLVALDQVQKHKRATPKLVQQQQKHAGTDQLFP